MSLMDCPNCGEKIAMNCSYPVFRCPHCYQKIMIRLVPIREWEKDKSPGIVPIAQKQNGDKKAIQSSGIDCEHLQTWDATSFYCNKERKFLSYAKKPCENCQWTDSKGRKVNLPIDSIDLPISGFDRGTVEVLERESIFDEFKSEEEKEKDRKLIKQVDQLVDKVKEGDEKNES